MDGYARSRRRRRPGVHCELMGGVNPAMAYQFARNPRGDPFWRLGSFTQAARRPTATALALATSTGTAGRTSSSAMAGMSGRRRSSTPWTLHNDWQWPHASTPMLVTDLTATGERHHLGSRPQLRPLVGGAPGRQQGRLHQLAAPPDRRPLLPVACAGLGGHRQRRPARTHHRPPRAHSGNDPGDSEPGGLYYFKWDKEAQKFQKFTIAENGPGVGLKSDSPISTATAGRTSWSPANRGLMWSGTRGSSTNGP